MTARPASFVRNSSWMVAARAYTLVVGGALSIYAVRSLSITEYGQYGTAMALIGIMLVFSDNGIASLSLRRLTDEKERSDELLGIALAAEAVTSVAAAALMFPIALALGYPPEVLAVLAAGVVLLFAQGFQQPLEAALNSRRVLVYVAAIVAIQATVTVAVGFSVLAAGAGAVGYAAAIAAGHVAAALAGWALVRGRIHLRARFAGALAQVRPFLWAAVPIALTGAVTVLYAKLDVLLLSKLDSTEAVAIYNLPLTLVEYALILPGLLGLAFFPQLAETLRDNREAALGQLAVLLRIYVLIAVAVAIFMALAGTDLLGAVFGDRYRASGSVVAIMAASVPLGFLNSLLWYAILAGYRERPVVLVMLVGLAVNAGLNVLLIPAHGPDGAAAALVASDLLVVAGQAVVLERAGLRLPWLRLVPLPLAAGAAAAAVGLLLAPVSGIVAGAAAALTFAAVLLLTRFVTRDELRPLLG